MANHTNTSDEHHCRCFMIGPEDILACKKRLEEAGFEKQPGGEKNHGQAFGLRYRFAEVLQMHFKVMPNGLIESEAEPPPEYPGAHLNQKHSFSPHMVLPILLDAIGLKYTMSTPIPDTCNLPKINKPDKPLSAWEVVFVLLAAIVVGYLTYKIVKK